MIRKSEQFFVGWFCLRSSLPSSPLFERKEERGRRSLSLLSVCLPLFSSAIYTHSRPSFESGNNVLLSLLLLHSISLKSASLPSPLFSFSLSFLSEAVSLLGAGKDSLVARRVWFSASLCVFLCCLLFLHLPHKVKVGLLILLDLLIVVR